MKGGPARRHRVGRLGMIIESFAENVKQTHLGGTPAKPFTLGNTPEVAVQEDTEMAEVQSFLLRLRHMRPFRSSEGRG